MLLTTKNEEWIVGKTLKVLSIFCDKIIILDDNSSDKTKEICESFANTLHDTGNDLDYS